MSDGSSMKGLSNGFNEVAAHGAETNIEPPTVQEWMKADFNGASLGNESDMPEWFAEVDPKDISRADDADALCELRSMIVGDPADAPDDNEGFQKVIRH